MKQRSFVCAFYAMIIAVIFSFAPSVMAANSVPAPTFVQEVSLSQGNWLWNHYMRMSVSYRNAHPYQQFMGTDACFLTERKCTEKDWLHVAKTQKIYIPADNVFVKVEKGASIPAIGLSALPKEPNLFVLSAVEASVVSAREKALESQIVSLKKANGDLNTKYVVLEKLTAIGGLLAVVLCVSLFFFLTRSGNKRTRLATSTPSYKAQEPGVEMPRSAQQTPSVTPDSQTSPSVTFYEGGARSPKDL